MEPYHKKRPLEEELGSLLHTETSTSKGAAVVLVHVLMRLHETKSHDLLETHRHEAARILVLGSLGLNST